AQVFLHLGQRLDAGRVHAQVAGVDVRTGQHREHVGNVVVPPGASQLEGDLVVLFDAPATGPVAHVHGLLAVPHGQPVGGNVGARLPDHLVHAAHHSAFLGARLG